MSLPRRVLIAAPQPFFSARGTPIGTSLLIRALGDLGAAVDVLTYPLGSDPEIDGVTVARSANPLGWNHVPAGFSLRKVTLDVPFLWALRRRLRQNHYDAVQANEEAGYALATIVPPRKAAFVYDMASSIPDELRRYGASMTAAARALERRTLRRADMVVCSAGLGEVIRERTPEVAFREWIYPATPMEVDPAEVVALRRRLRIPEGSRVVLYAGTFARYQATDLLTGAVAQVVSRNPQVVFVFVGIADDEEMERVRRELGGVAEGDHVRLVPRVRRDQLATYMALAEVLLSSRGSVRNVPLKLFDALAARKPLVANDVSGHAILRKDSLALLVPSTPEGFAAGILQVLGDSTLAGKLTSNAGKFATERLRWQDFVNLVSDVYERALTRKRGRSG